MDDEKFDVIIEVGHKATLKEKVDSNGNTHKWNAFVRSGDPSNQQKLDLIVKKVVFNLHETFKNPKRHCISQPYCVRESGYGQFEFPIDIYFNGIDTKYSINYYLELPSLNCTTPLSRVRKEKITFINPCPEFRRVLVEGGGILHKTRSEHPTNNKMSVTNEIIDNKPDHFDYVTNTPKLNMSNSSNNSSSLSSSSSSSFSSSPPLNNSSLTPVKKPSLKNKLSSFTLNSNQNQSNQKLSNSNHNSSLLKPSNNNNNNNNPNSSMNTSSTNETSFNKTNKKNNLNRSKGKSTVLSQTVSPQTARSMSISPSPKEKAKSSSPNNDSRLKLSPHLKLCSPQTISSNIHDQAISPRQTNNYAYNDLSFNDTNANTTDGSFLEVEHEIEIKTEVDVVEVNNSLNSQSKNNKKRPLNMSDSMQMSSLLDCSGSTPSLTGLINNLNGSSKGLNNEHQAEENSVKKKRFRSQENGLFDDDLSFTNENNKPGKKFNDSLNGEGKKLKKNHSNNDLKNGAPLSKAPSNNKLKENERASSIGNTMQHQATTNDSNNNYIESTRKATNKLTNGELKTITSSDKLAHTTTTTTNNNNKNKRMKRIKSEHQIETNGMRNSPIDHENSSLTNGQRSMLENNSMAYEMTELNNNNNNNNATNISLSPQFSSLMTPPPSLTSSHSNTNAINCVIKRCFDFKGNNGSTHLNGRRSVSPYTINTKQSSAIEASENNSIETSKQFKSHKISKNLTSKSASQSPVPSISDHSLNIKKSGKLKGSESTQNLNTSNKNSIKKSTQNKEPPENTKSQKKTDNNNSTSSTKNNSPNLKSDSTSKKQSESREKSSEKSSSSHRSNEKTSDKKYDNTDRNKLPSTHHDRRSMENGVGKHSHLNGSSNNSGSNNRYHTSHNNLGNLNNDNYQNNSPVNSSGTNGSRSTSSHKDNQNKNPIDNDKDNHHHRSHSSHRHSSHDNSRRHSSASSNNNHSHHRSNERDLKDSRFSSSSSRHSSSTSNRISSDRKSSEKSSSKNRNHDLSSDTTTRQKNSSSSYSNRVGSSATGEQQQNHIKKEEVIEDLNRKLRRGKMDEENMKMDDDNCSHASTLSTMSNSSSSSTSSSSILSNKLNTNEKYEKKKNLKNDSTNKSKNNWDQRNHVTNTHNNSHSTARQTKENTLNGGESNKISKDRMLKIFERINQIFSSKQYDLLAKICTIVMPFGFTDNRAFRFDLFALETNVIEELESLLLNESLYDTFNSIKSNHSNINNVPNSASSQKSISSVNNNNNSSSNLKATNSNHHSASSHSTTVNKKSSKTTNNNSTSQHMLNNLNNSNNNNNVNNNTNNFTTKTKELKTNIIK